MITTQDLILLIGEQAVEIRELRKQLQAYQESLNAKTSVPSSESNSRTGQKPGSGVTGGSEKS